MPIPIFINVSSLPEYELLATFQYLSQYLIPTECKHKARLPVLEETSQSLCELQRAKALGCTEGGLK